jgi:hypothetical protein
MADYYSVIANTISRSSSQTEEARRAIYERARTALREALRDYEPPLLANELRSKRQFARSGLGISVRHHDRSDHVFRDRVLGCDLTRPIIHSTGA